MRRLLLLAPLLIGACGVMEERDGPPGTPRDLGHIPDAVPRYEPKSPYGNPEVYEVRGRRYHVLASGAGYRERGLASWYGRKFHGRRTSSGEPYDMFAMTAAHPTLPLPTYVEVTNLKNGRRVIVRVNDRGPFAKGRIIDLSYAAAYKLGILEEGTAPVEVRAISVPPAYVQVGAFRDRARAGRMEERLAALGIAPVRVVRGKGLYRVLVGPFREEGKARRLARRLADQGFEKPFVTWDESL